MNDDSRKPVKISVVLDVYEREAKALERLAKRHKTTIGQAATVAVLLGLDVAEPPTDETRKARVLGPALPDFYTTCIADPDLAERFEKAGITRELFEKQQRGEFVPEWLDVWGPEEPEHAVVRAQAARLDKLPPTRINPRDLSVIEKDGEHYLTVRPLLTAEQKERVTRFWVRCAKESPEAYMRYLETLKRATRELIGEGSGDAGAPPEGGSGTPRRRG